MIAMVLAHQRLKGSFVLRELVVERGNVLLDVPGRVLEDGLLGRLEALGHTGDFEAVCLPFLVSPPVVAVHEDEEAEDRESSQSEIWQHRSSFLYVVPVLATLRADLEATRKYTGGIVRSLYPSFFAVALYRLGQALRPTPLKPVGWLLFLLNQTLTGAELPPTAKIGDGLFLVHTHGIVVSPGSRAGRNLVLFGGVTLGSASAAEGVTGKLGDPILGDHVTVFAKASVLGPVVVGDHVTVAAHAVVLDDVPDRTVVGGIPARALSSAPTPARATRS
jgi:serine O-acetyltransferase